MKEVKKLFLGYKEKELNYKFSVWQYAHLLNQIKYVLAITGLIYVMMGSINFFIFTSDIHNFLIIIQLIVVPSYAFMLSYLAYKKVDQKILETLLFLAPVLTSSIHAYIFSHMESYSSYQTELYLMIFWNLTISGLRLNQAIVASLFVFAVGEIYPLIAFEDQNTGFLLNTMWMLASLLLGIVGGILLHLSKKNSFEKELELHQLATMDKLTGVHNRVELDSILVQELRRAERYKSNIGVLLLDIDHFKNVNDTYGHLVGDEILIGVSKILSENIRASDYIFRFGGEEFLIICLEADEAEIFELAEKIRLRISQYEFPIVGYKTLSIGATINHRNDTVGSIIRRADEALYEAKQTGRNRVRYK
ncbi:GGDEF domain-containing protein [Sulfurimonas sp. C5]|uniref:GGDEF domain-containing protein n=1 Tax=Sulfurimonas sp. C5 TaxID=3036947 RepID=UPI00245853FC|nr:GGDEF domain-containing protein [Sulfurimonas sp. C5]MDH4945035.1 GGDEF domain-containing protein [Sulfurimonas sp. C5]